MPKQGYTKRHFTEDFKMRTVYELKNGLKNQNQIVDTEGNKVSKTLTDRWMQKLGNALPSALPATSYQFVPLGVQIQHDDLLAEIGRLHLKLAKYESNSVFGGRRKTDTPVAERRAEQTTTA